MNLLYYEKNTYLGFWDDGPVSVIDVEDSDVATGHLLHLTATRRSILDTEIIYNIKIEYKDK